MSKQKIVLNDLFGDVVSCHIHAHPSRSNVFAITGDDQLKLCRFDWKKDEGSVFEQTSVPELIGCLSFNSDGSRIICGLRSGLYSMDSEVLSNAIDKRAFSDPVVCMTPFNLGHQSYNLVLGDEAGNLHLVDFREATTVKDQLFKGQADGVSITSIAVDDKIVYVIYENGIVEAFDLKKREFIQGMEFGDKMLTHVFLDEKTPVVTSDEGEVMWLDMQKQRVKFNTKESDLIIERVTPISDEFAIVKPIIGDNLMLLSTVEHKFVGEASHEPALDVDSTADNKHIILGLDRNGHVNVEVWETKTFLNDHTTSSHKAPNGDHSENGFFDGLVNDDGNDQ